MAQHAMFICLLMVGAVINVEGQTETSFTFTPTELSTSFGYVTELRSDITIVNDEYWKIVGDSDQTPIDMSLRTTVLSGTDCTASKFQVYYNARHTSSEGDGAIIISAGDEYISFMFDYDGGVWINADYAGGIAIYPACGSNSLPQIPYDSTDASDLFDDATDKNSANELGATRASFVNWRDRMAGGDRENWTPFNVGSNSRVNSHTTGFNVGFEMDNSTMTISFWTQDGGFSTSCQFDTVFSFQHGSDINVDFSPDYDSSEVWRVYGITVTTDCSAETIDPTIAPSDSPSVPPTIAPSASPSNAPINAPTQQPTVSCVNQVPQCPSACSTDPCECDNEEIGDCNQNTCHSNGCDQCNNGSFKKYYNYPCVSCQETFGSDCMHCTDFLGCQQCSNGVRTYDSECGLYYCNTC